MTEEDQGGRPAQPCSQFQQTEVASMDTWEDESQAQRTVIPPLKPSGFVVKNKFSLVSFNTW